MKSDVVNLKQLLEGGKQYNIPLFQRNYSWEKPNWQELWIDLMTLLDGENKPKSGNSEQQADKKSEHFLGPLITLPCQPDPAGLSKFMLIDGQQRITTLCILLNAIRFQAKEKRANDLDEELQEEYIVNKRKADTDYYKLLPGKSDREAYLKLADLNIEQHDSHLVFQAFRYFLQCLRREENRNRLVEIKDAVLGRMSLISIVLDPKDNAYEIFSSINSKGLSLTEAELIKNFLLMRMVELKPQDQESVFEMHWTPMEEELGDSLTEFIRHVETRYGNFVNTKKIFQTVRQRVDQGSDSDTKKVLEYLGELSRLSKYYIKFLNPDLESDRFIRLHLQPFHVFKVGSVFPYLLNVFDYYEEGNLTLNELLESLAVLENLLVRRLLINDGNQGLNKEMPGLHARVLKDPISAINYVKALKKVMGNHKSLRYVSNEALSRRMKVDGLLRNDIIRYVLNRIEDHLANVEPGTNESGFVRILPQKPNQDWLNYLSSEDRKRVSDYADLFGNMTLYKDIKGESKLPDGWDYSNKRKQLLSSGFNVNASFVEIEKWDLEAINNRTIELIEWIQEIWPEIEKTGDSSYADDDPTGKTPMGFNLLGERFTLGIHERKWNNFYTTVLNHLYELHTSKFRVAAEASKIELNPYDSNSFRVSKMVREGMYVETSLSAVYILKRLENVLEALEYDEEDYDFIYS